MEKGNRWETEEVARQVCDAVSDMLESLRLGQLNQAVRDTAGSVLEEARNKMEQCRNKAEDERWRRQKVSETPPVKEQELNIRVNWRGRVSGILFTVFGSIGSGVFTVLVLAVLIIGAVLNSSMGIWLAGMSGLIAAGFGVMLFKGISQTGRIGRLKKYVAELKHQGKTYCEIETLSRCCGKSPGFVRKDLRRILGLGMLPDARMDKESRWLMLDEETYRQYELFIKSLQLQKQEKDEEERKRREAKKEKKSSLKENVGDEKDRNTGGPVDMAIRQGEEYMETLDGLRESIPAGTVREKLMRLDRILEKLFDTLKKHPDQLDEMEKFMEYYLPTTVKLVSTYQEFAAVEFPGDNIREAKEEIEKALDTINHAFEKFLDDLYEDAALDIITDASVLTTMLAKEGMTGDGVFLGRR